MKRIFIILLLIFGIVTSGFSRQYIWCLNGKSGWPKDVVALMRRVDAKITEELDKGSTVVSITPVLAAEGCAEASGTIGFIIIFDDGKSEVNNEACTR